MQRVMMTFGNIMINMFSKGEYNLNEDEKIEEKIKKCIAKLLSNGLKEYYHDLAIFMPDVNVPPEVLEVLWNKSKFEVRNIMNKLAQKSITNENYALLPNDNYTLQYIGYHIFNAEAMHKFDIYFDLKFLEAKIRAVGKEDENILKEKLDQYREFIKRCGSNIYSYEKTDIIQFALERKKIHQRPVDEYDRSTIHVKDDITSACFHGTVILWKFAANSARNSSDLSYMFSEKRFVLSFCDKFPEIFRIATGSSQGNVIIWDAATGARLYATGPRGYSISSLVYIISEQNDPNTLHNTDNCKYLFFTDNKLIAVAEKSITLWDIVLSRKKWVYPNTDPQKYYVCSTLTDDSSYLVVSTNLKNVYIMNFEERKLVKEFKSKGLPKSLDTFYDEDKSVHILLIGSDKRTLQQCHILPDDKQQKIAGDFCFIPHWKKKCPLTALVSRDNKIQIFSGSVTISETDVIASKVTCTCFSINGQNVIYGLANGEIHMYNLRHKKEYLYRSKQT
ncbi:hypothetical protein NQ317_004680 [Molorchus minor]|uniref:Apoptotic protease-activating factor 1 winged-helix domain-containing protein n=1 Tax=Molorchus minor TaxID=1323400 RepID=A0ABQ9JFJ8_9CUCU|nr:hypothetical protein NQ317_004680 [Molorchus minor]